MRTLLTKKQQAEWLQHNRAALVHKWSTRGYGNSKIYQGGEIVGKASGCGYDRFGATLGKAIETLFPVELQCLADRFCKTKYPTGGKASRAFYGLFKNSKGKVYLDGACGDSSMREILAAIGFNLRFVGETENAYNGEVFYTLEPATAYDRKRLRDIK